MAASEEIAAVLPPSWSTLVGFESDLARWRTLVKDERLPPVMLLTGREGIGKRALLSALAAMHVCESEANAPCGSCGECSALLAGDHPEVLWLEAEQFLLDAAERLQEHIELSPMSAASGAKRYRLAIVVDADRLTVAAANRLLKTLEEPPATARILMSSSRPMALLPTVRSRCVRWLLKLPRGLAEEAGGEEAASTRTADLSALFKARSPVEVIDEAERLARQEGWSAAELATAFERELNRRYRHWAVGGEFGLMNHMAWRREVLRKARRLAGGARVPLNGQLLTEGLALPWTV